MDVLCDMNFTLSQVGYDCPMPVDKHSSVNFTLIWHRVPGLVDGAIPLDHPGHFASQEARIYFEIYKSRSAGV